MKRLFLNLWKKEFLKGIIVYSLIFVLFVTVIYGIIYVLNGKLLIWKVDGIEQHYMIFVDYINSLKEFLKNGDSLFFYDLNIGLGADNYTQYIYYIIGDPFAYLGVIFPSEYLDIVYSFLILLRLYFVGISFYIFSKYMKKNTYLCVIGAVFYAFSSFAIFSGPRHPYFLIPMIVMPLLFLAIERLLRENKKIFFSVIIFIMAIFNFYFLYMLIIFGVIYFIIRLICLKQENKKSFCMEKVRDVFVYGFIGILSAMFILLPVFHTYLTSGRTGIFDLFMYPITYYKGLYSNLISFNHTAYWSQIFTSFLIVLLFPIIIKNYKKEKPMFIFFIITLIFLLFSIFGSFMNGLSFPNNRYSFAFCFATSYLIISNFKWDLNYTSYEKKLMLLSVSLFLIILLIFNNDININLLVGIVFLIVSFMIIVFKNEINKIFRRNYATLFLIITALTGSLLMCYNYNSPVFANLASNYLERYKINETLESKGNKINGFKQGVEELKKVDKTLYRITDSSSELANLPILYQYNSISSYLSLSSKYEKDLATDLLNDQYYISRYINQFSNRSKITTLLGSKYFITNKNNIIIPYGYSKYKDVKGYESVIYKNNYALPLGMIYTDCITQKDYDKLTALEKEDALISSYISKECKNNSILSSIKESTKELNFNFENLNNLKVENNKILVTPDSVGELEIDIENSENSELYLMIEGFDYRSYTKEELKNYSVLDDIKYSNYEFNYNYKDYVTSNDYTINAVYNNRVVSSFTLDEKSSPYYLNKDNILINLGYLKKHKGKVNLSFMNSGIYYYKDIKIIEVSFDTFSDKIEKIKENPVDINYKENEFYGTYNSKSSNGVMQLSVPYDEGWKVYVDGKEKEVKKVNNYFLGTDVEKGTHTFKFVYKTKYLKEGIILSFCGVLLLAVIILKDKIKSIKNKSNKPIS